MVVHRAFLNIERGLGIGTVQLLCIEEALEGETQGRRETQVYGVAFAFGEICNFAFGIFTVQQDAAGMIYE